jgi:DNA-binding response OmpR family regulator
MRFLVIEDEPQIGSYLGRLLGEVCGIVDVVESVSDARQALSNFKYDLAIVDRMLPDGDALGIVAALSQLPERRAILMLTAKDAKEDVIEGLNSGSDDYLGKPFEPQELIARVRALLRRPRQLVPPKLSFGNVELKAGTNEASVAGHEVLLRRREALILEALLMRQGRVIPRDVLTEALYVSTTRSSQIRSKRSFPGCARNCSSSAATWKFAACEASAISSGWRRLDDIDHQDAHDLARRGCGGDLRRHGRRPGLALP